MADKLRERPGWTKLCEAGTELHAAELLLGDPLTPARTAVPHLREFWRVVVVAAGEANIGQGTDAAAWLEAGANGLDARTSKRLAAQVRSLADAQGGPGDTELHRHARDARKLLEVLEPRVGGAPLLRRRNRILWGSVGLVILFAPVLGYVALHREVEGEGPWRAAYFTDRKLESSPIIVREPKLEHDWDKDAPLEAVPPDKFSVRWDTCLRVDEAATVTFQVHANDAARVFVDGATVIDAWDRDVDTRKRGFGTAAVELDAGVHHLRVEYFESLGSASIQFAASFADEELPTPLPRERLLYPGDDFDEDDPCAAVR